MNRASFSSNGHFARVRLRPDHGAFMKRMVAGRVGANERYPGPTRHLLSGVEAAGNINLLTWGGASEYLVTR